MTTLRFSSGIFFSFTLALMLIGSSAVNAQQSPIAKVSATNVTTIYTQLDDAITASADGDIIYLPGGAFTITQPIAKRITIMGVGHYPDSSSATGITSISGDMSLRAGASNFVLDGVYLSGSILVNDSLTSIKIFRSNILALRIVRDVSNGYLINGLLKYCVIRNTVFADSNLDDLVNTTITNCFLYSNLYFGRGAYVANCVILSTDGNDYGLENNSFYNCIIFGNPVSQSGYVRSFVRCTFSAPNNGNTSLQGCYFNKTPEILFGKPIGPVFNYTAGFYKVVDAEAVGLDNTEVGLYGGSQPYKEGAIPPSPHIRKKEVDATTGVNGTLKIKFNVGLQ